MARSIRLLQILALFIAVSSGGLTVLAGDKAPCRGNDITAVDFTNMKIALPDLWGKVQLSQGVGYKSEAGLDESKDWKITIEQDEILRPSPSVTLRLLRVTCNHLTGSGAWDDVLIYCCRNGRLVRVFHDIFHYGVRIQKPTAFELLFEYGEWTKNDPHCCPSMERVSIYRWNEKIGTYTLVKSSVHPSKKD
jgi:hypothetical protein